MSECAPHTRTVSFLTRRQLAENVRSLCLPQCQNWPNCRCKNRVLQMSSLKPNRVEENLMSWKTPKIVEIALGAEINCYACADLK